MILTQKKINDAILKAKCCLASKTIKYFNQLSYGKDDMNLFKCINVLDIAIETLCKFEIVGSTSECPCTIEGTFLIEGLNQYIQFNNDGTGYVNNQAFIWYIDNSVVHVLFNGEYSTPTAVIPDPIDWPISASCEIQDNDIEIYNSVSIFSPENVSIFTVNAGFTTTEEFIDLFNSENTIGASVSLVNGNLVFSNLNDPNQEFSLVFGECVANDAFVELVISSTFVSSGTYTFNYTCDENGNLILSNFNDFLTYIASLNITNPPFTDTDITLSILDNNDNLQDSVTVSSNDTPEEIVNQFNEENTLNLVMQYNAPNNYQIYSPLFNNYTNYTFSITEQSFITTLDLTNYTWGGYKQFIAFTPYSSPPIYVPTPPYTFELFPGVSNVVDFVNELTIWLNNQTNYNMIVSLDNNILTFITNSSDFYQMFAGAGYVKLITYINDLDEGEEDNSEFFVPITYQTTFQGAETLNLINQEECTPETIEQTCLSNKQIGDIINYINKTCTDC
jgi:hypothetical protein